MRPQVKTITYYQLSLKTLKVALPIIFGQLGIVFMGFVDVYMLGQYATTDLAAVGLANALFFLFFMFAMGVTFAISPLVAIAKGSGRGWKGWLILRSGVKVSMILSVILIALYLLIAHNLNLFNQGVEVSLLAKRYLEIVAWSVLPMLLFMSGKQYLDGYERTVPASVITVLALLLNIVLNKLFIFGFGSVPAMGIEGAAWATLLVRLMMFLALFVFIARDKASSLFRKQLKRTGFAGNYLRKMWVMGIPIGLQFFFEVAAFSFAMIMAGWIGEVAQAAHNISISLASVTYMGATGLSAAGAVLVGAAFGSKNLPKMRAVGIVVLVLVMAYMLFCAISFVVFRYGLANAFTNESAVITLTVQLLIVAAFFQVSDGLQSAGMGLLRGVKDVKVPSFIAFISYWIVGIPVSYLLAFRFDMGMIGVWIGFVVGLSLAGVLITLRFFGLLKKYKFEPQHETII